MRTKQEFEERWPVLLADVPCGFYCPKGWADRVWKLLEDIESNLPLGTTLEDAEFKITQVKEKFGGLRFYYDQGYKGDLGLTIRALIVEAERDCWNICLTCGGRKDVTTGVTGGGRGWTSTQCLACRALPVNPRTPRSA